jgi:phosphomannomutase
MSAHHYFRDFACCDSGMIPWLLIVELMSRRGVTLADLVSARMAAFPSSGEMNFVCNSQAPQPITGFCQFDLGLLGHWAP